LLLSSGNEILFIASHPFPVSHVRVDGLTFEEEKKKEIKGMRIFRRVRGSIFIRLVLSNRAVETDRQTEEGNWAELP
jgi:hypothetical protein